MKNSNLFGLLLLLGCIWMGGNLASAAEGNTQENSILQDKILILNSMYGINNEQNNQHHFTNKLVFQDNTLIGLGSNHNIQLNRALLNISLENLINGYQNSGNNQGIGSFVGVTQTNMVNQNSGVSQGNRAVVDVREKNSMSGGNFSSVSQSNSSQIRVKQSHSDQ